MATKKAATTKKATTTRQKTVSTTKTKTSAAAVTATSVPSFSASIRQASFWRSLSAELLGTFLLTAVVIVGQGQPLYTMFGLVGIILLLGTVSGAHVNPAITIGAWVTRRISWLRAIGYIIFQILGALLALVVLTTFIGGAGAADATSMYGQPTLFTAAELVKDKELYIFFAEVLGTAILALAIANALRPGQERLTAAFTGGLGIFIALMIGFIITSYVSGTSIINPAIAFSLEAISWNVWPIAVYIVAPIVGGVIGFLVNDLLKGRSAT